MMKNIFRYSLIIFFICSSYASAGQTAEREVMSSGLILLHAEKKAVPIVTLVMAIKAGSINEPPDKSGLANLTASLLNEGTKKRSSKEISEAIEFVGGNLGTSAGADYITVTLTVLKKDIELGFDLLSDIILNPVFSESEINREKTSIKSSLIQQNEEPRLIASKAFAKAVYGEHPYGRYIQGSIESIDALSREDIIAFYNAWYAPNNTIMSIVGDISMDEAKALISRYLGAWQKKEISKISLPEVSFGNKPEVIKIQKDLTQATIAIGHIGIKRENPDYYAVTVMNYILGGGGFASRLVDNIRDNKGLAYDVHSYFSSSKYSGSFQAGLQTKNAAANTAIQEILKEMNRIRTEYVTDKELDDAKAYLTGSFPLRLDSNSKIAGFNLAVEYYGLGIDYVDSYKKIINAVTKDEIKRVANQYLNTQKYVLVVVADIKKTDLQY